MGLFHGLRRSYNPGSKPISYGQLVALVQRDLMPREKFYPKDLLVYAYTLKQYRRLAKNIGDPEFDYGQLVRKGQQKNIAGSRNLDSDPDCDDFRDDAKGKMNLERILVGSDRPALFSIDYRSLSRNGFHGALVALVADEHNDDLSWWVYQYDTQRWEQGTLEIATTRELW